MTGSTEESSNFSNEGDVFAGRRLANASLIFFKKALNISSSIQYNLFNLYYQVLQIHRLYQESSLLGKQ
jgi:hypothetical protein